MLSALSGKDPIIRKLMYPLQIAFKMGSKCVNILLFVKKLCFAIHFPTSTNIILFNHACTGLLCKQSDINFEFQM